MNSIVKAIAERPLPAAALYYAKRIGEDALAMPNIGAVTSKDTSRLTADAIITTSTRDREGDVVQSMGLNLSNYRKNPVWLWSHDSSQGPVGKSEDSQGNLTVWLNRDHAVARCAFHTHTKIAEQTAAMVMDGFVRSVSIGFQPHRADRISAAPTTQKAKPHGAAIPPGAPPVVGWRFDEVDLLEISWTAIGMNPDAIATTLGKGIIAGSPIDPVIHKHLLLFAPPARVQVVSGYETRRTLPPLVTKGTPTMTQKAPPPAPGKKPVGKPGTKPGGKPPPHQPPGKPAQPAPEQDEQQQAQPTAAPPEPSPAQEQQQEQEPIAAPGDEQAGTDVQAIFVPQGEMFPDEQHATNWAIQHNLVAENPQWMDPDQNTGRPGGWLFTQFPHEELQGDQFTELDDGVVGIVGTRDESQAQGGTPPPGGKQPAAPGGQSPGQHPAALAKPGAQSGTDKGRVMVAVRKDETQDPQQQTEMGHDMGALDQYTLSKDHLEGEQQMMEQPQPEEEQAAMLPPSASLAQAFKELWDTAGPMQEHPEIRKLCEEFMGKLQKFCGMHHKDLDFGWPQQAQPLANTPDGSMLGDGGEDEDEDAQQKGAATGEEVDDAAEEGVEHESDEKGEDDSQDPEDLTDEEEAHVAKRRSGSGSKSAKKKTKTEKGEADEPEEVEDAADDTAEQDVGEKEEDEMDEVTKKNLEAEVARLETVLYRATGRKY